MLNKCVYLHTFSTVLSKKAFQQRFSRHRFKTRLVIENKTHICVEYIGVLNSKPVTLFTQIFNTVLKYYVA